MAATMYSGFWGPNANDYSILVDKMPRRYAIKRVVNRDGFRAMTELFDSLIGAATGGTAAASHARVGHNEDGKDLGKPIIETVVDINRATTAADVTALKEMVFNVKTAPAYPADRSGNGGGALS
jgi:hypothetical protein